MKKLLDAWLYRDSTPEKFRENVNEAINLVVHKPIDKKIIFLDSWNEWGEGAYMEPDIKYGHQYLDVLKKAVSQEE